MVSRSSLLKPIIIVAAPRHKLRVGAEALVIQVAPQPAQTADAWADQDWACPAESPAPGRTMCDCDQDRQPVRATIGS